MNKYAKIHQKYNNNQQQQQLRKHEIVCNYEDMNKYAKIHQKDNNNQQLQHNIPWRRETWQKHYSQKGCLQHKYLSLSSGRESANFDIQKTRISLHLDEFTFKH